LKVVGLVAGFVGILLAAAIGLIGMLARRVVGVQPRRKTVAVRRVGDALELPRSDLTIVDGNYGLWFGERFEHHALIGPVVSTDGDRVLRRVLKATAPISEELFEAHWTGHTICGPAEIDPDWEDVNVPLRDGTSAPAWLFRGESPDAPWVIHVQGVRTSRLVTLRSVKVAQTAGLTSLVITYRGAGDGPTASASALGQREWTDLADAVNYARSGGAVAVYAVAWSMGAGLALELLRRDPVSLDRLALIAPATDWRRIIRHKVRAARLPGFVATIVVEMLGSRTCSWLLGMPDRLDFERLEWCQGPDIAVSTLAIHSRGDDEIPFDLTSAFAGAHSNVTLVETAASPHGWEANVDPGVFRTALVSFLSER